MYKKHCDICEKVIKIEYTPTSKLRFNINGVDYEIELSMSIDKINQRMAFSPSDLHMAFNEDIPAEGFNLCEECWVSILTIIKVWDLPSSGS